MMDHSTPPDADLQRGIHVLQAFEAQALELHQPSPQDRQQQPQQVADWDQALQSAVQALLFMLASAGHQGPSVQQLEAQLQANIQQRSDSVRRRDQLLRDLELTQTDIGLVRSELELLEQALRLAALRAELSDRGRERVQRTQANQRLARHARHNAEALERIDGEIRRLEEEREEKLHDDIEQTEQFWNTATREVET